MGPVDCHTLWIPRCTPLVGLGVLWSGEDESWATDNFLYDLPFIFFYLFLALLGTFYVVKLSLLHTGTGTDTCIYLV
jgi:hypothetical protein